MRELRGTGVSAGIAIGPVKVLEEARQVVRRTVDDPHAEIERFHQAQQVSMDQLARIREDTAAKLGEDKAELFDTHRLMLKDPDYVEGVEGLIQSDKVNAEYAVDATAQRFATMFAGMDSSYMQARAADVQDISRRLIDNLGSGAQGSGDGRPTIIMASDLAPSQTAQMDPSQVLGFATSQGSANSHTAILARTMGLPAVIGLGQDPRPEDQGLTAIVDGSQGLVLIDPDQKTLEAYKVRQREFQQHMQQLQELKGKPTRTKEGQEVHLYANIGRPSDLDAVEANDAEGIGLFRSEFLYLESEDFPTEESQFQAYKEVAQRMGDKPVIIRTLDIGADKQVGYFGLEHEANPALGYRAIRICLTRPEIFKVQLRAILRASAFGNISIMLPMITSTKEVDQARAIIDQVKEELRGRDEDFKEDIQVGIMVETPASVVMAPELARKVDFFSIGTNDLTQYTLACDRQNPNLGQFADPHSPAVLRMIRMAVDAAHQAGIWCGICGELGADRDLTATFLDYGLDELSVSPASVLPVREAIRAS
ncbi:MULTISPECIES: phosphoenolpyruvate--protein phosphotransferase [Bifidobacterium]|uniref:phosphoenolpyruvate--protein phosphotransferase n=1 Tax=Bifidobacterium TaxID=1678 RepID=UPI0018DE8DA1|nr:MULTISPECIES: phosphoenolpyruvate--protein phosphotransferase [Bifidobacterium]MBH9981061.1 phosphoenolpyruvate--protein phosphotransferase [Bifidobacterium asteroides]MBI0100231.1 phosphoenolpyruvate--protein phosphotransferase [Bifidobacterium sp. W8114]